MCARLPVLHTSHISNIYLYSKYKAVVMFLGYPAVFDVINKCGFASNIFGLLFITLYS